MMVLASISPMWQIICKLQGLAPAGCYISTIDNQQITYQRSWSTGYEPRHSKPLTIHRFEQWLLASLQVLRRLGNNRSAPPTSMEERASAQRSSCNMSVLHNSTAKAASYRRNRDQRCLAPYCYSPSVSEAPVKSTLHSHDTPWLVQRHHVKASPQSVLHRSATYVAELPGH